jgi:hypothetical protein
MNQIDQKFETPILFLIFNRPASTRKVFEVVKKVKPTKLFIAADGPRKDRVYEAQLCEKTRSIANEIDWECELKLLFRDNNLGCGPAVSQAITWFFSLVDYGIILEDDCLPHLNFFPYCQELLKRYLNHEKVMFISGNNFQDGQKRTLASYYFSVYTHIWGWATWKNVWNKYDYNLYNISLFKMIHILLTTFKFSLLPQIYFLHKYLLVKRHRINTWDYQIAFTLWKNKGISIIPENNLVTNIGIGEASTHTGKENIDLSIPLYNSQILPLIHNQNVKISIAADKYFFKNYIVKQFIKKNIGFLGFPRN